jgi:membrane fusion protein (multidrug efflux system)
VLGDRVGQDYIITEGVKPGERIIIEGLQKARPGATVNPVQQAASAEPVAAQTK